MRNENYGWFTQVIATHDLLRACEVLETLPSLEEPAPMRLVGETVKLCWGEGITVNFT